MWKDSRKVRRFLETPKLRKQVVEQIRGKHVNVTINGVDVIKVYVRTTK